MTDRFTGKVCLITGGAGGIGLATAQKMAAEGGQVVIADLNENAGAEAVDAIKANGGSACFIAVDVSSDASTRALVEHIERDFGRLDVAFNNAGIEIENAPIIETPEAVFDKVMAVNVKGVFLGLKYQIPLMLKQGQGSIVNTASVAGLGAAPKMSAYAASKHAVIGQTKTAAIEFARHGIRVNAICPAVIRTAMFDRVAADDEKRAEQIMKMHPMKRIGEPEEIANAVAFMASDECRFMTGACLNVDGGLMAI